MLGNIIVLSFNIIGLFNRQRDKLMEIMRAEKFIKYIKKYSKKVKEEIIKIIIIRALNVNIIYINLVKYLM